MVGSFVRDKRQKIPSKLPFPSDLESKAIGSAGCPSAHIMLRSTYPAAALLFSVVYCFGEYAHQLIAKLAWMQLKPPVQDSLQQVLKNNSFAKLSFWADTVKHQKGYEWTRQLHYATFHDDPPGLCQTRWAPLPEPNVISAALHYTLQFLADPQQINSLAFMIHFFMDFHMPLHCSPASSSDVLVTKTLRGGLEMKLTDDVHPRKRRVSLHYLLDSLAFHRIIRTPPFNGSYARFHRFMQKRIIQSRDRDEDKKRVCITKIERIEICFQKWALQSNRLNCQGLLPTHKDKATVTSYVALHRDMILGQVLRPARHLSSLLNVVFAQRPKQPSGSIQRKRFPRPRLC